MTKKQTFKITLTGESVQINQMEVAEEVAAKIIRLLMPIKDGQISSEGSADVPASPLQKNDTVTMTVKKFMAQKQPQSDMERVTCLAYYLTNYKGMPAFKTIDLTHLNVEAAQPKLSNPSATARNSVSQQYLASAGGGKKQITERGEALVNALPDRSAVKNALEKIPLRGHRKRRTVKRKKSNQGK